MYRRSVPAERSIADVVLLVCRLPVDFHADGTVSATELVRRSGYAQLRSHVSAARLAACLGEHPEWVDAWFNWSEDNRSTPSWFIAEVAPGRFEVAFYDGLQAGQAEVYGDRTHAAVAFIKHYLDATPGSARRAPA